MRIPAEPIPHCPKCGREMDFNLFQDDTSGMKAGILHMTAMKNTCHATKPEGFYTLSWASASIRRAS